MMDIFPGCAVGSGAGIPVSAQSVRYPCVASFLEDAAMVGHEIRLIEYMPLDEFRIETIFAQETFPVLENLPQQGFANGLKIDQVNGAPRAFCKLRHQRYLCFNLQRLPRINGQVDIAVMMPSACGQRAEKNGQPDFRMRREGGLDHGLDGFHLSMVVDCLSYWLFGLCFTMGSFAFFASRCHSLRCGLFMQVIQ